MIWKAVMSAGVALALSGCVAAGNEGPTSTLVDESAGSLGDRREANRTVRVVQSAPAGMSSLGAVSARRCHRNAMEAAPTEENLVADLRLAAFGEGADAIRYTGSRRLNGLLANCWYVVEGTAEMYAR